MCNYIVILTLDGIVGMIRPCGECVLYGNVIMSIIQPCIPAVHKVYKNMKMLDESCQVPEPTSNLPSLIILVICNHHQFTLPGRMIVFFDNRD